MTFDTSRSTFDPWKDYAAVVMEQGRVQLDSDWNEWLAEVSRRTRAGTLDLVWPGRLPAHHAVRVPDHRLGDREHELADDRAGPDVR